VSKAISPTAASKLFKKLRKALSVAGISESNIDIARLTSTLHDFNIDAEYDDSGDEDEEETGEDVPLRDAIGKLLALIKQVCFDDDSTLLILIK
jgi:hypothetical protein